MKRLTKEAKIIRMLESGGVPLEIATRIKCKVGYVYAVRSKQKKKTAIPVAEQLYEAFAEPELKPKNNILDDARGIIYGDREKTYGNPAKNLTLIGKLWGDYLGVPIDPNDVCLMMILLKTARLKNDTTHRDGMVDGVGYFALMERIQEGK